MTGADSQAHLYPLTEERALWRWVAVRAAGFPAAGVDRLVGGEGVGG